MTTQDHRRNAAIVGLILAAIWGALRTALDLATGYTLVPDTQGVGLNASVASGFQYPDLAPALSGALCLWLAAGLWKGRPWAMWLGIGYALCTSLISLMAFLAPAGFSALGPSFFYPPGTFGAVAVSGFLLHAALTFALTRPEPTHPRTALSLLMTGAAMPLVFVYALRALDWIANGYSAGATISAIAGGLSVVVGALGLARGKTWGLLTVGIGGLLFVWPTWVHYLPTSDIISSEFDWAPLMTATLLAAALPFAGPATRWLRRERQPRRDRAATSQGAIPR